MRKTCGIVKRDRGERGPAGDETTILRASELAVESRGKSWLRMLTTRSFTALVPFALCVSLLAFDSRCAMAQLPTSITPIGEFLARVSTDSLMFRVRELCGERSVRVDNRDTLITHRHDGSGQFNNELAGDYLEQQLRRYGLAVESRRVSPHHRNIIATQRGTTQAGKRYILCAHYDSVYPEVPGADDNASGTAAVLEAARILSRHSFTFSVEYAFWDGEESGLAGSTAYARTARMAGDSILGVINLDMIAWDSNSDGRALVFATNERDVPLANTLRTVNDSFAVGLDLIVRPSGSPGSDDFSFVAQGYPAVLLIEDMADFNPNYHREGDKPDALKPIYFRRMAQQGVGALALLAEQQNLPLRPRLIEPADAAVAVEQPVLFRWEPVEGATDYELVLASDSAFTGILFNGTSVAPFLERSALPPNSRVFWRVRACHVEGCGHWSAPRSFLTQLASPVWQHPLPGGSVPPEGVRVVWTNVDGASRYHVQLSEWENFRVIERESVDVRDTSWMTGELEANSDFHCRVRAVGMHGPGPWSDVRAFSTTPVSAVSWLGATSPNAVHAPSPHPVCGKAVLSFTLERSDYVRFALFDLVGRCRAVFAEGFHEAGRHEFAVDLSSFPTGGYAMLLLTPTARVMRLILLHSSEH